MVAVIADFWQALAPVKPTYPAGPATLAADAVVFVVYLTLLTAFAMTLLDVDTYPDVSARDTFSTMQAACLWNILDAVPAPKVPDTVSWTLTHPVVDKVGGRFAARVQAVAVIPAVAVIVGLLKHSRNA